MTTAEIVIEDLEDTLVTEISRGRDGHATTARQLYDRWENQHWTVSGLDYERDRVAWQQLRPLYRGELLRSLVEIEVGEVSVAATLSSLVEHAATEDDQLYLATQLADEARHVVFFQTYLEQVVGSEQAADRNEIRARTDYGQYFDGELRRVTKAIHSGGGDRVSWCTASVYYHLVTEGVLASTALRTTRHLAKTLGLQTLDEGLTNVTRDESRHIGFGLMAARRAVADGLADTLVTAYHTAVGLAAKVLVGPHTKQHVPVLRMGRNYRAAELQAGWSIARGRVEKQLVTLGLDAAASEAVAVFDLSIQSALDTYAEIWGRPHPVRLANN